LVVLSIAIGVGIVGIINNARYLVEANLYGAFQAGVPAHVQIYVSPFQQALAAEVEGLREVRLAQPRRLVGADLILADGSQKDLTLNVVPDLETIQVNTPFKESGQFQPKLREVVVERQAAEMLGLAIGDPFVVEMADERTYTLTVVGIVHDLYEFPYSVSSEVTSYISMSTLEWMGLPAYYNRLDIVTNQTAPTRERALEIGMLARDRKIEPGGYVVGSILIPGINADPGQHWAQDQITGFVLILQIMSVMSIFLSGGLVVNTIAAILTQQVRQIGIMRSVGAVRPQITAMYIFNVLVFAVIGLLIALPIGSAGSLWLGRLAGDFLNFTLTTAGYSPHVLILMVVIAMIVPVGVALGPILSGVAISVYDAIYQFGKMQDNSSWFEAQIFKLKGLPPQVMISLQNTFRNVQRLGFTLATLTLAGATFVAVFSTRASLNAQVNELVRYVAYDTAIRLPYGTNRYTAEREALRLPGVAAVESWASAAAVTINADGSEGEELTMVGLPDNPITLEPKLNAGRWLTADDTWQVVINNDLREVQPDLEVGSQIRVKIGDVTRSYTVVGIMPRQVSGPRMYIRYDMFTKITNRHNQADEVRLRSSLTTVGSDAEQDQLADLLETRFRDRGISSATASVRHQVFSFFAEPFDLILVVLVAMAALLAVVGGISLTGTMGINVLERTREIGVLRAVGATNDAVRGVVVVEGVFIALVSWLLVSILAVPTSAALSAAVIDAVMHTDPIFEFSIAGLLMWLGIVVVIGILASLAPAQNAVSLTVREVLDYE
jgi:putative ABC transport system permease protein